MPDATGKRWYLIQCKPRQASRALEHLERQGYECLLPLYFVERPQKGKLCRIEEPLFPGYLFIFLDKVEDNWLPIRSTRGVNQIVSFGGIPAPIPEYIIEELIALPRPTLPALIEGDRVKIDIPNFRSLDAIFISKDGNERALLLLSILNRELVISISSNSLKKLDS
ncbi:MULTISPECIES: transcription/translation regulatory transformer protein RfaH [unclassified Pseudomonas]|uniref:transcription/translation regulatory transformer protein RfaH n=1 Tax=unclassified Pseudomonas TaxID=196821 RepID=UPI0007EDCD66|nr:MULTISPECIES: transcription/translation regulatory transformer protein RfaH [unclassified Pseudomonas]OBP11910.1 hypothetical protein BAE52_07495 [Pseudomonas sp. EGD-AKN5]QOF86324.1 transcription/translation regulatory transformer protein RfaH [Pseudomonas sp. ADPe]